MRREKKGAIRVAECRMGDISGFGGAAAGGATGEGAGWDMRGCVCSPFFKRYEGEL